MSDKVKTFKKLFDDIRETNTGYVGRYLNLIQIACETKGNRFPDDNREKQVYGDDVFNALSIISDATNLFSGRAWSYIYEVIINMYQKLENLDLDELSDDLMLQLDIIITEMKEWKEKEALMRAGYLTKIAIIQKIIDKKAAIMKGNESDQRFQQQLSVLLHDINNNDEYELANSDDVRGTHVYMLFSDGSVYSTKGGSDLFLARSMFKCESAICGLNDSIFNFPHDYGKYKYAVFENEEKAINYRKKMIDMYTF